MAADEGSAQILRDALADVAHIEKRMFGGVAFMVRGHMVLGTTKSGAIFRVGKAADATALALPGVRPMNFTGKVMAGFVECGPETLGEQAILGTLTGLALAFNKSLPPK